LAGDKAAVEQCIARLEAVTKSEPQNQLARVYLGSAYTLRSRDLGFGPGKLRALKRGLALMDKAVAAVPDEPKVRLARALTTLALPSIFGRKSESRQDFVTLAQLADKAPAKFEESDLEIVYYRAGLAAKETGDQARAIALWKKALAHPVDPKLTEKLRAELPAP
jgi:tetratricopeptide (TPR) repeat protein